jgi:hypothetical protein
MQLGLVLRLQAAWPDNGIPLGVNADKQHPSPTTSSHSSQVAYPVDSQVVSNSASDGQGHDLIDACMSQGVCRRWPAL